MKKLNSDLFKKFETENQINMAKIFGGTDTGGGCPTDYSGGGGTDYTTNNCNDSVETNTDCDSSIRASYAGSISYSSK